MNRTARVLTGMTMGLLLSGAAIAAAPPAAANRAPAQADCQKSGGEVSALIDAKAGSPNIAAARSLFQVGIMECMEGADDQANKHYTDAKKLLTQDQQTPASAIKLPAAGK